MHPLRAISIGVLVLGCGGLWFVRPAPLQAQTPIQGVVHYTLQPQADTNSPELAVQMEFAVPPGEKHVDLQMPVWSPGDYHVQNHGHLVEQITARASGPDGRRLPITRPDVETWEIATQGVSRITVSYVLPDVPAGIFSENVHIERHYAFFNGPATYLYVVGHKETPAQVTVYPPRGWHTEMPLPEVKPADAAGGNDAPVPAGNGQESGSMSYSAPDYDTLADSPLVMGDATGLAFREFTVDNIVHRAVYFAHPETLRSLDVYTPVLQKIAQAENDIMGGPPYKHYDFLFAAGEFPAGLEHLNSARIGLWPNADAKAVGSLVAHEFFHLWNVKRIRPRVLGPFDYIHPPHTRNLWFAEGVTEYYAHVALRRAGLTTETEFFDHWRQAIRALQRNPAHLRVTADEASMRVWEEGNSDGFGGLSYYQKGELIGLCLDLKIRAVTQNRKSLDDVMRALMQQCNLPKPGYGEDDLKETINKVADQDLSALYDSLARSTDEMPFAQCLGYAGLDTDVRPKSNATAEMLALRDNWSAMKQ